MCGGCRGCSDYGDPMLSTTAARLQLGLREDTERAETGKTDAGRNCRFGGSVRRRCREFGGGLGAYRAGHQVLREAGLSRGMGVGRQAWQDQTRAGGMAGMVGMHVGPGPRRARAGTAPHRACDLFWPFCLVGAGHFLSRFSQTPPGTHGFHGSGRTEQAPAAFPAPAPQTCHSAQWIRPSPHGPGKLLSSFGSSKLDTDFPAASRGLRANRRNICRRFRAYGVCMGLFGTRPRSDARRFSLRVPDSPHAQFTFAAHQTSRPPIDPEFAAERNSTARRLWCSLRPRIRQVSRLRKVICQGSWSQRANIPATMALFSTSTVCSRVLEPPRRHQQFLRRSGGRLVSNRTLASGGLQQPMKQCTAGRTGCCSASAADESVHKTPHAMLIRCPS